MHPGWLVSVGLSILVFLFGLWCGACFGTRSPQSAITDEHLRQMYALGFEEGFRSQGCSAGMPNHLGNLPYTQGSYDAEARLQREAVTRGFAKMDGESFIWNGDTQRFPRIDPQRRYRTAQRIDGKLLRVPVSKEDEHGS